MKKLKCYRSIAVSNLHYGLKTTEMMEKWYALGHRSKGGNPWWLKEKNYDFLQSFISWVLLSNADWVLSESMKFSAYRGGRFNPEKSFECLYVADSPETSALEVLYHLFTGNRKTLRDFKKIRKSSHGTFKSFLPDSITPALCVIELELSLTTESILDLTKADDLKKWLTKIGMTRYLKDKNQESSSDLVLGNEYDICNLLGGLAIASDFEAIKFRSARSENGVNYAVLKGGLAAVTGNFSVLNTEVRYRERQEDHEVQLNGIFRKKVRTSYTLDNLDRPTTKRKNTIEFPAKNGSDGDTRKIIRQKFHSAA